MIVISGALVLVALVLLIIGLVSTSLPFVYASIAVSVVSFVFLLIGILQRRNEKLPEDAVAEPATPARSSDVEGVTAIIPAGSRRVASGSAAEPAAAEEQDAPVSGSVLVVAGRPRYHVSGCRYLTGKDPDEVAVESARDEGFTACGVCKPDAVLAEEAAAEPHPQPDAEVPAAAESTEETVEVEPVDVEPADVPDPVTAARKTTRAKPTQAPGRTPAVSTTAAKKVAAKKAPAKAAAATSAAAAPAKRAPAKKAAAKKAPSAATAAAVAGTPAAASAARKPGSVVVIPDRGKFHAAECRYVRGVEDAEALSRAAATKQGYDACGVCKP